LVYLGGDCVEIIKNFFKIATFSRAFHELSNHFIGIISKGTPVTMKY